MPSFPPPIDSCLECQFGDLSGLPGIDVPGLPSFIFGTIQAHLGGAAWILDLLGILQEPPDVQAEIILNFTAQLADPKLLFESVFLSPFTSSLTVPLPALTLPVPPLDAFSFGPFRTDLPLPHPGWLTPVIEGDPLSIPALGSLNLMKAMILMPFQIFISAAEMLINLEVPSFDIAGIEEIFNGLALSVGLPAESGVGKLGGCLATAIMEVLPF